MPPPFRDVLPQTHLHSQEKDTPTNNVEHYVKEESTGKQQAMSIEEENFMKMPVCSKSVPYGDDQAILQAFDQDGYCVVTGILTESEVEEMMKELWSSERLLGKFDRNDPNTWGDPLWPQQDGGKNFLQSQNVFQDATPWDLEGNEKLLHIQRLLFKRNDLMMASIC